MSIYKITCKISTQYQSLQNKPITCVTCAVLVSQTLVGEIKRMCDRHLVNDRKSTSKMIPIWDSGEWSKNTPSQSERASFSCLARSLRTRHCIIPASQVYPIFGISVCWALCIEENLVVEYLILRIFKREKYWNSVEFSFAMRHG